MTAPPFAILVEFVLHTGARTAFMPLMHENAQSSVRDEPGCRRFDVLTPREGADPDTIALYEIYDDRDAFEAHKRTPHFLAFRDAVRPLVRRQTVTEWDTAENAKA